MVNNYRFLHGTVTCGCGMYKQYEDTVQYNHMTNLNSLHTFLEFPTDVCVEALHQAFKLLLMGRQIVELHNDIHEGSGAQYS